MTKTIKDAQYEQARHSECIVVASTSPGTKKETHQSTTLSRMMTDYSSLSFVLQGVEDKFIVLHYSGCTYDPWCVCNIETLSYLVCAT